MSWIITKTERHEKLPPDTSNDDVVRRVKQLQEEYPDAFFDVNWVELPSEF